MTTFDDRERAFEAKHVRDDEIMFRVRARRNRLVGEWAAGKLSLSDSEKNAYASAVVSADFEEVGDEDIVRKLVADFSAAGVAVDDSNIRQALEDKMDEARRQLSEAR